MEVLKRLRNEQEFHDRQARQRAAFYRKRPGRLLVSETQYLDHEPWIRPALAMLGCVEGRHVLDFGCGHGMAAVILAQRGARVTAFDLSGGYLAEARTRAAANQVLIDFVQANGEYLPFADETFDCIWGNAVLHHLDLLRAGPELRRILKPDGKAVFSEPWGGNPLLNWARNNLKYPAKARTPAETPLDQKDLAILEEFFPGMDVSGQQLFSMVGRMFGRNTAVATLNRWDQRLLARFPSFRRWCRYVVLTMEKKRF